MICLICVRDTNVFESYANDGEKVEEGEEEKKYDNRITKYISTLKC